MRRWLMSALLAGALGASGCYRYIPAEPGAVPMGDHVRLSVSRAVLLDLEETVPVQGASLRGRIAGMENGQILLRVPVATRQVGFHSEQLDQQVQIPLTEVSFLERRELDRLATVGMIGGAAGAAAAILFVIMDAYQDEGPPPEECPDCVDFHLPIFRIPLGR